MMTLRVIFLGVILCLSLASCEPGYEEGYEKGASDTIQKMNDSASKLRSGLREDLYPKLIFMSIVAVFITLLGTKIAEQVRKDICSALNWGKDEQLSAAWLGYMIVGSIAVGYTLTVFGFYETIPVLILLGGTFPSFYKVVDGIEREDASLRKSGMGKLKTLYFMCLVVIMVYHLLTGGVGNIRVG